MSTLTMREIVASTMAQSLALQAMGLVSVFDADTVDAPTSIEFPFIVVRWGEEQSHLGNTWIRYFDIWVYLKGSDRTPAEKLARAADELLVALEPQSKSGGWLVAVESRGNGPDLWDDAYQAMVVQRHMTAVASGD